MAQGLFIKRFGALRPVDDKGRDDLAKVRDGDVLRVEWKRARNPRQFALYWALVSVIADHQDAYPTKEQVSDALKIAIGYCDEFQLRDGRTAVQAKSIAFGNMGQDQWEEFFQAALTFVADKVLPGVTHEELRRELESMVSGSQPVAAE